MVKLYGMKNGSILLKQFANVDAVLLKNGDNCFYLTEYANSDSYVLLTQKACYYLTDDRYFTEACGLLSGGYEVVKVSPSSVLTVIKNILGGNGVKRLGFEDRSITYRDYTRYAEAFDGISLTGTEDTLLKIRAVKTDAEAALIRKAAEINDKSFGELLSKVREGVTEQELKYELEYLLHKNGADGIAFDTISAFGTATANPHAHPTDRKLVKGMPVTLDFGCKYKGYCSDITRTFFFGTPSEEFKKIYRAVLSANENALDAVSAGKDCAFVDKVARETLKACGLAEYFTHGTGHGVGICIHESPVLNPSSEDVLAENMVVTVEPGVYIAGLGGVRVEDMALVTSDGVKVLSKTDKKLTII